MLERCDARRQRCARRRRSAWRQRFARLQRCARRCARPWRRGSLLRWRSRQRRVALGGTPGTRSSRADTATSAAVLSRVDSCDAKPSERQPRHTDCDARIARVASVHALGSSQPADSAPRAVGERVAPNTQRVGLSALHEFGTSIQITFLELSLRASNISHDQKAEVRGRCSSRSSALPPPSRGRRCLR